MNERHKHGGEEAIERTNQEAIESEDERRERWLDATLKKIARRAMGSENGDE